MPATVNAEDACKQLLAVTLYSRGARDPAPRTGHNYCNMPRACHPLSIDVRIEDGEVRVFVFGQCPKCGTGSGELDVQRERVHYFGSNEKKGGTETGTCIQIDGCYVETVCALETCGHSYAIHT